jgi:hypothetical protein
VYISLENPFLRELEAPSQQRILSIMIHTEHRRAVDAILPFGCRSLMHRKPADNYDNRQASLLHAYHALPETMTWRVAMDTSPYH